MLTSLGETVSLDSWDEFLLSHGAQLHPAILATSTYSRKLNFLFFVFSQSDFDLKFGSNELELMKDSSELRHSSGNTS